MFRAGENGWGAGVAGSKQFLQHVQEADVFIEMARWWLERSGRETPERMDVARASLTLWAAHQETTLQAEVKDSGGTPMQVPSDAVSWSAAGAAVVGVDGEGRLTALEDGSGRVAAAFDNVTGEASVLVDATFS